MKKLGKVLLIILIVLALLFTVLIAPRTIGSASLDHMAGYHYAHRGYHDGNVAVPENSLSSFVAAIDAGYGIELDIHLLKDGTLAVFHDGTLDRTTGKSGRLEDLTEADLADYPLEGSRELIPLFSQVLQLYAGKAPLIIELKDDGNSKALVDAAVKAMENAMTADPVKARDYASLLYFQALLMAGLEIDDPAEYTHLISKLMV